MARHRAIPLLTGVLERYDERQTRESALYTSWLRRTCRRGDIEHAAALTERTLELSSSTSSSRGELEQLGQLPLDWKSGLAVITGSAEVVCCADEPRVTSS
jgi:hypothetical protein